MHSHSHLFLPVGTTAHDRIQWQHIEDQLCKALAKASYDPPAPHYINGDIQISDPNLDESLRYSSEANTWCPDCAQKIYTAAVLERQAKVRQREEMNGDLNVIVGMNPSQISHDDLEELFSDTPDNVPHLNEDLGDSSDVCCSGCGETLYHDVNENNFTDQFCYYSDGGFAFRDILPEDIFCILKMMNYKPGDPEVCALAQSAVDKLPSLEVPPGIVV